MCSCPHLIIIKFQPIIFHCFFYFGGYSDILKRLNPSRKTNLTMRNKFLPLTLILVSVFACQNFNYEGKGKDVPTAGTIQIGFDYGDSLMVNQWIEMFQYNYPKAHIIPMFANQNQLLQWIKQDSIQAFVLHNELSQDQQDWICEKRNIKMRATPLAYSSIAFIVSKNTNLQSLSLKDLLSVFCNQEKSNIKVALENNGINILQINDTAQKYLGKKVNLKSSNVILKSRPQDIIDYVQSHDNVIGVVSLNLIASKKDKLSIDNLKKVKVLSIGDSRNSAYYLPFQSQIKAKQYPFIQSVIGYDFQGYSGLANGFITYVRSQTGQIIVKKSGLVPAFDEGRTIEIVEE